jgi:fucose 4-O-acetylase-like acetyltransferase
MVMGHAGFDKYIFNFIYMFHMPLFFIISGFLFSTKYGGVELFVRRIKSLYFPFIKYNLIFLCLHNLFLCFGLYSEIIPSSEVRYYSLSDFLLNAAYIVFLMLRAEPILGALWFLRELFVATFVIYFTLKLFRKTNWQLIFLSFLLFFSFYVQLPIQRAIITPSAILASIFFYTGYKLKDYKLWDNIYINSVFFIVVFIGSIVCPVNMQSISLSNIVLFYFCALFGFLLSYNISKKIATIKKLNSIFIFIGDNFDCNDMAFDGL